jgi:hypothetical protein
MSKRRKRHKWNPTTFSLIVENVFSVFSAVKTN